MQRYYVQSRIQSVLIRLCDLTQFGCFAILAIIKMILFKKDSLIIGIIHSTFEINLSFLQKKKYR